MRKRQGNSPALNWSVFVCGESRRVGGERVRTIGNVYFPSRPPFVHPTLNIPTYCDLSRFVPMCAAYVRVVHGLRNNNRAACALNGSCFRSSCHTAYKLPTRAERRGAALQTNTVRSKSWPGGRRERKNTSQHSVSGFCFDPNRPENRSQWMYVFSIDGLRSMRGSCRWRTNGVCGWSLVLLKVACDTDGVSWVLFSIFTCLFSSSTSS